VLWLATWTGKMVLPCPHRITCCVSEENTVFFFVIYNKSFVCFKMAGCWSCSFCACLWTSNPSRSPNTQKRNLANIQPSWPHAHSITHIYSCATWCGGPLVTELYSWPRVASRLEPRGNSNIKRTGVLVIPFRDQKQFWYLLGCSASKDPQRELLRYLLGYWAQMKMTGDNVLF